MVSVTLEVHDSVFYGYLFYPSVPSPVRRHAECPQHSEAEVAVLKAQNVIPMHIHGYGSRASRTHADEWLGSPGEASSAGARQGELIISWKVRLPCGRHPIKPTVRRATSELRLPRAPGAHRSLSPRGKRALAEGGETHKVTYENQLPVTSIAAAFPVAHPLRLILLYTLGFS